MNAFGPAQWFLAGLAIGLLGCAAVWLLLRRSVAGWRERNHTYLTDREMDDLQRKEPGPFVRALAATLWPLGWLLGTRDRAVYRATFHTQSWSDLCSQVEESVRASDPGGDGFTLQVIKRPSCIIRAYRGMTSGFSVQLIPQRAPPGGANVLLLVSRWSRWHTWGVHVATAGFFLTLLSCVLALAVTGWQFPGAEYVVLAVSFCAAFALVRVLLPGLTAVESSGRNRLTDDDIAAVVERIRTAVGGCAVVAAAVG